MAEWKELMLKDEKYTDAEVDAIVLTHKNITGAHHTKYTDAEAVTAVVTADDYVKNDTDDIMTVNSGNKITFAGDGIDVESVVNQTAALGLNSKYSATVNNKCAFQAGTRFWWSVWPAGVSANIFHLRWCEGTYPTPGTTHSLMEVRKTEVDWYGLKMKNMKNHAASALSGTKKLVEIDINGTSYYFEVYPTKA